MAAVTAVWSAGAAGADSYAGQTYGDASQAIASSGRTAIVASRSGTALSQDDCIVTRSQNAPFAQNSVLLFLNCNATLAGPGVSGNSAASPEGQAAINEQNGYIWKSTTEDGAAWCTANIRAHPDWGPSAFAGCPDYSG
jgi:hypothetical protein